jgi:hypothetical protein
MLKSVGRSVPREFRVAGSTTPWLQNHWADRSIGMLSRSQGGDFVATPELVLVCSPAPISDSGPFSGLEPSQAAILAELCLTRWSVRNLPPPVRTPPSPAIGERKS